MTDRSNNLNHIRPIIPSALIYDTMSDDERFQNTTLRPVIKLQNELLIGHCHIFPKQEVDGFSDLRNS